MTSLWHLFTDGKNEYDYLTLNLHYLGLYEQEIEYFTEEFSNQPWSDFHTLTKGDYDENPDEFSNQNYAELKNKKQFFDPQIGIERFKKLQNLLIKRHEEFEGDLEFLMKFSKPLIF